MGETLRGLPMRGGYAVLRHKEARKTLPSLWQHEQANMLALCRTGMENQLV